MPEKLARDITEAPRFLASRWVQQEVRRQLFKLAILLILVWLAFAPVAVMSNQTAAKRSVITDSHQELATAVQLELDRTVEQARDKEATLPGIIVAVSMPDGSLLTWASGQAEQELDRPMTQDDHP